MSDYKDIFETAVSIKNEIQQIGFGETVTFSGVQWERLFDLLIADKGLRANTRKLFFNKHYTESIEAGFKYLNSYIRRRADRKLDGPQLMQNVFSVKNPVLKVTALEGRSGEDAQKGYMELFCGCLSGIRNPRAHEDSIKDDPETALEIIYFIHHLIRTAKGAEKVRD